LSTKVRLIPCLDESQAVDFIFATLKGYTKENIELIQQTWKHLQADSVSYRVVTEILEATNTFQREDAIKLQQNIGIIVAEKVNNRI
jgi:hypothetical protein